MKNFSLIKSHFISFMKADILDTEGSSHINNVVISIIFTVKNEDDNPMDKNKWVILRKFASDVVC